MVGLISNTTAIIIRSALSKVTPADELGCIFSMLGALEAFLPLIASPLMTKVYNSTLDIFPGTFLLVSALFYLLTIIFLSIVYILAKKIPRQEEEEEHASIINNEMTDNQ